ncbi:MAG: hypothetical protein QW086_03395 [Pyrobaculum sp.]
MKLWKFYVIVAAILAVVIAIPASVYFLLKQPPGVKTTVDVFVCDLTNESGTLVLKNPCVGKYITVTSFVANRTYLRYEIPGRLELETTAQDLWTGMTTVEEVASNKIREFRIGNRTYEKTPENLVPPPFRAALARLVKKYPWLSDAYIVNGGIFRGKVFEPEANQTVIGFVFSALQPFCGKSFDTGPGGGVINRYDSCRFTALLLINRTRLVVFDVSVELVNIDNALEIQERGDEIKIGGGAVGMLMKAVNNATRLLEEALAK